MITEKDGELNQFLKGLANAWHDGDVRPTHRSLPKPARHWRTRKDAVKAVWPCVLLWLQEEPDRTALELLRRLQKGRLGRIGRRRALVEHPAVVPRPQRSTPSRAPAKSSRSMTRCRVAGARRLRSSRGMSRRVGTLLPLTLGALRVDHDPAAIGVSERHQADQEKR